MIHHPKLFPTMGQLCMKTKCIFILYKGRRQGVRNGYFTVRLTVSVYPPPPYGQLCVNFLGVFFILDYDFMCSETDFTQEKAIFIQLLESPIPS